MFYGTGRDDWWNDFTSSRWAPKTAEQGFNDVRVQNEKLPLATPP
jgi:hypothetical protein